MNWEAIGATGEVVGAVAVFATLVYLAIQIRQNTASLKASSHHAITDSFNAINVKIVEDPATVIYENSIAHMLHYLCSRS